MSFSGTVTNQGTAAAGASSYTRLRIDINNDGTYDWTNASNKSTGNLAAGGSETENWSSVWTAVVGTHKYEICADVTSVITESNETNNCATQTFTVNTTPNNPPTCNAGSDKTVNENTSTTLDGSAFDPDGDTLTYSWACAGGSLNNSSILQPTYTAPSVTANTDYTCTLNVSDGKGGTCSDQMIVHVIDVPTGATIVPPSVTTQGATVTQTSATLSGLLNSLGYDPAICTNCQCIVWFEWGTSGTAGVSGSYGNSTIPESKNADNSLFTAIISGLTPGQTYYFEAFAKNGGSW
jgi:hypothetical protein